MKLNFKHPLSRRQERLELKYRGTLRCESCNRRTEVSMEFYKKIWESKQNDYIFFCKRERCLHSRPEGLVPRRKDRD